MAAAYFNSFSPSDHGHKPVAYYAGVPVFSINSGGGSAFSDFASGFVGNANNEVAKACAYLREQQELKHGFNFIGFSQGGQFARAVVQRCG
jgi:palmitoyl-protein thioesterase